MNNARRKDLERAKALIEEAQGIIESAQEEEQEYMDNMPESLQGGDRYETASAAVDAMGSALSSIEEVTGYIDTATE